jgi:hypothetical protein
MRSIQQCAEAHRTFSLRIRRSLSHALSPPPPPHLNAWRVEPDTNFARRAPHAAEKSLTVRNLLFNDNDS